MLCAIRLLVEATLHFANRFVQLDPRWPEMAREIMSRSSSFRFNTPRQITAPDAMLMKKHHRVNPALSAGDVIQSYQKIRKHFVSLLSQECSVATCVDSTQKIKTDVIFALYL